MSDRAQMPIHVRVRSRRNRLMLTLPITTLVSLLIGNAPTVARAQAQPAAPATPDATAPAAQAPDGQQMSPLEKTVLVIRVITTDAGSPPVPYAAVSLSSETERPKSGITTSLGVATFRGISDGVYSLTVSAVGHPTTTPRTVTITLGQRTEITVFMAPRREFTSVSTSVVNLLDPHDYSISYTRDSRFMHDFPFDAANHQDLNSELLSVPGVARDSGNNYYARGDGAVAGSTIMDGIFLPPTAQGRVSSLYSPAYISSVQAIVGNFAPEYTGNGMVLNLLTTPIPTSAPYVDINARAGNYNSAEDGIEIGSRGYPGGKRGAAGQGQGTRTFAGAPVGYVISLSQEFTDNAVDPPQASPQNIANHGESDIAFAKVDFNLKDKTSINALINYAYGRTDIADRTGLPDSYAATGQGFGFGGLFTNGTTGSQQFDGKSDFQTDYNLLTAVRLNKTLTSGGKVSVVFGTNESSQDTASDTPLQFGLLNLPANYSTEYKPFITSDYQNFTFQLDYTAAPKNLHEFKVGLVYQGLDANEAYQLVPGSQLSLDSLYALDPRLAPAGGSTNGTTDALGFRTYTLPAGIIGANSPVLVTHRTGSYAGGYAQDTWQVRQALLINYGVRLDSYSSTTTSARFDSATGNLNDPGIMPSLSTTAFSPRINGVFNFPQTGNGPKMLRFLSTAPTLARFGYNHLFSAPGMNQGNFIGSQSQEGNGGIQNGTPAQPETTDQLDINIERQVGLRGRLRVGFYDKTITNYLEMEQLLPGLQSDLMAVFNQGAVVSDGTEITYELLPDKLTSNRRSGIHAFVSFENSDTHPKDLQQFDNLGYSSGAYNPGYYGRFAPFVDGDQSDTLSFGISSTAKDGSSFGLSGYYGSGLYSSAIRYYFLPVRQDSTRQGYSQLNFRYSTGPRFLRNTTSIQLEIANLLNSQERIDYLGAFDGTRFQQGTRAFLGFSAHL